MLELERPVANLLARRVPVPRNARQLLDLGGGPGLLGAAVCVAHPPLRSTVIELDAALPAASHLAQAEGISSLVTHRAGDLATCELEPEVDVALLCNVLHHFSPPLRRLLVRRTFDSLKPNGTIAIWETEARADATAPELASDAIALYFRVTSSAPALTASELGHLLSSTGFERLELIRPLRARGRLLVHARKPRAAPAAV
jgi:trans-aconitate methyltransferase